MTERRNAPATYLNDTLQGHGHVCAFFPSPADEYRILLPFVKERMALGERVVQIMPSDRHDHLDRLRRSGIDVNAALDAGQLELLTSEEVYLRDGRFDESAMLESIKNILVEGHARGFPRTCLLAHAEHVFDDSDNARAFLEYEIHLNLVLAQYTDSVICVYDLQEIRAGMAAEALRAHQTVLVNGVLMENPHFVSPAASLSELLDLLAQTLPGPDPRRRPRETD